MQTCEYFLAGRQLAGQSGHESGRALLDALYRRVTGQTPPPIAVTSRGKPFFPDSIWHFSITHTPNHVFCALARCPIGIDGEEKERNLNLRLADKVLSAEEYRQWASATDQRKALLTFWVLKEAAAKCSGEGLQGYPNHTAFSLNDPRVTVRDGCLLAVITAMESNRQKEIFYAL